MDLLLYDRRMEVVMGKQGKRVAIYTRVSTDDQSTRNQTRELTAYVRRREGWTVAEGCLFTDQGVSGTKERRLGCERGDDRPIERKGREEDEQYEPDPRGNMPSSSLPFCHRRRGPLRSRPRPRM